MNVTKTDVVIDKSFLQGAPKDSLECLFNTHRVLMLQGNFYELLTTTNQHQCFKRIPALANPVARVEGKGTILRWEINNQRPLLNIDPVIIQGSFTFNPGLINENFKINEDQTRHLEDWAREVKDNVRNFVILGSQVPVRFPELTDYRPGNDARKIEEIKKRICTDKEFVRELYNDGRKYTWPSAEQIDERWAIFKWRQIKYLAALDYYRKYGEIEMSSNTPKIENEYLDLEYCLVGCIAGAIATHDNGMKKRFLAICPTGKVIS
ncbi:MAG: hypothetical protein WD425_16425 [Nitrospirales bacterium]